MTSPQFSESRALQSVASVGLSRRELLARVGLSAAAVGTGLFLARPLRAEEPPFRVMDFDWHDTARGRDVPVRLYLPRSAPGAAPNKLVVFSHGMGGSRRGYSYLGSHWASHGIASLHPQHIGSDRSLWMGTNVFGVVSRLHAAAQETEASARVHDLRFALDTLSRSEFAATLNLQRVAAAGHSYGANTALLAAGAHVEREGKPLELRDPRIATAIVISAPPFYGEESAQKVLESVRVPSLHVTCTEDIIRIPGYYSGLDDRIAVYEATGSHRKVLAVFQGGSHSIFTDRGGTGGVAFNPQVKEATRELTLAFLQSVMTEHHGPLRAWPERHAGLLARFTQA